MNLQHPGLFGVFADAREQLARDAIFAECRVYKYAPQVCLVRDLNERFTPQPCDADEPGTAKRAKNNLRGRLHYPCPYLRRCALGLFISRRPNSGRGIGYRQETQGLVWLDIVSGQWPDIPIFTQHIFSLY